MKQSGNTIIPKIIRYINVRNTIKEYLSMFLRLTSVILFSNHSLYQDILIIAHDNTNLGPKGRMDNVEMF